MTPVRPVAIPPPIPTTIPTLPAPAPGLSIGQGQCFSYALPPGWQVGEDGAYALTLMAPDRKALTLMVGNAGLPGYVMPGQYLWQTLMAIQPMGLQLSPPRPAQPVAGFHSAQEFDVSYFIHGVPCQGIARCHVAPGYDAVTMAVTAALSEAAQWPAYASWLPQVAEQISATNGAAFGRRGVMVQNLQNSMAYADAAQRYRDWSQQNWQSVVDQRNASVDRQQFAFRENLGAVQTWVNPYDTRVPIQLTSQYSHYWVDRQGNILGTNDPGDNPNGGSTGDWSRMPHYGV